MRLHPLLLVTLVAGSVSQVGCGRSNRAVPVPTAANDAAPPAPPRPSAPPNALTIPVASVEAVLNPQKLPAYSGPTGSVEGTIYMRGPDAPVVPELDVHACPAAIDTYGKLFRAGPPNAQGQRPLADAVVGITGYNGYFLADDTPAVKLTIGPNCAYPTRTIVITFGQRLEIDNASKIAFAPRLDGVAMAAVMIAPPEEHGGPVKIYPPRTGRFQLIDTLQPFITEDLFVVRQPLHAVSDLTGHYRIDKVPIGKLKVSALMPSTNAGADSDVDVREDVIEKVDLTITYTPSDAGVVARPRGPLIP